MDVTFRCPACDAWVSAVAALSSSGPSGSWPSGSWPSGSSGSSAAWRCPCGAAWVVDRSAPIVLPDLSAVTLGEGDTPLVRSVGSSSTWLKLEYASPTLSFKDRGAVVLAAAARAVGAGLAVCDSSGNAGAAAAAYFARARIPCEVFVPASAAPAKVAAAEALGATVRRIDGPRAAAAAAATERVEEVGAGAFYASHVWNPLFFEGTGRFAHEVVAQLGGPPPSAVFLPFGNGSLLLGVALAFGDLVARGAIDRGPRLYGVRPWARPTMADGAAVDDPPRGDEGRAAITASGGAVLDVGEEEIASARDVLAAEGVWAEPTGALALAGFLAAGAEGTGPVVVAVTGSGARAVGTRYVWEA